MPTPPPDHPPADPTLVRRARIARMTEWGQRVGYALFGLAIAVFAVGAVTGFTTLVEVAVVACLAAGSVVLAPAIVFGYAVRAAEREDRERAAARRRRP
jgi:hypothetical protein